MNPEEKKELTGVIRRIYQSGITLLLVEHDMNVVMSLCDRIIVLDSGALLMEGSPEQVQHDPRVIEVYLGKGYKRVIGTH
jgi:branched-chain amino acid transport system ATP-binding protein